MTDKISFRTLFFMDGAAFFESFVDLGLFFLFFGGAFVSLCAFYDDRVNGPLKRIQPYSRFLCLSYLMMLLDIGLFFWFMAGYDDVDDSVAPPFILTWTLGVMNWPLLAFLWLAGAYLRGYDFGVSIDSFVVGLLCFATGLFWGYVVERLLNLVARFRSKSVTKSTQIT